MREQIVNGSRYTDENAYFLDNGDIVPRVCPYCKCEVDDPHTYLEEHDECLYDC